MTVETVKTRLITICESITGVKGASRTPRNVVGAEMPWCVVLAGPAEFRDGSTLGNELREYRLILLVQSWAQGPEYEAEELAEPFFERFRDEFMQNTALDTGSNDPLAGVQNAQLIRDTGVTDIELAGVTYSGVEFTIQVWEQFNVCKR
ncbi:MAG: hypothetical protein ACYS7Y_28995 [Planctomycetota bacterium]|jgi:hypothetical protein